MTGHHTDVPRCIMCNERILNAVDYKRVRFCRKCRHERDRTMLRPRPTKKAIR